MQTQSSLSEQERHVLGVQWNVANDMLVFGLSDVAAVMKETRPTKRNAVSLATRFFDPTGVITPLPIRIKLLLHQLCETKVGWDEPLEGKLLQEWEGRHLHLTFSNLHPFQYHDDALEQKT